MSIFHRNMTIEELREHWSKEWSARVDTIYGHAEPSVVVPDELVFHAGELLNADKMNRAIAWAASK